MNDKVKEILNTAQNGKKGNLVEAVAFTFFAIGVEETVRGGVKLGKKVFNKVFPKKEAEPEESENVVETTEEK